MLVCFRRRNVEHRLDENHDNLRLSLSALMFFFIAALPPKERIMKKQESSQKKIKKSYKKPLLIRYQKLTSVVAGGINGSPPAPLGCTRF